MKLLLIACLPRRPSLGESLALELRASLGAAGHELLWHDLYEEGFDPVLDPGELDRGGSLDSLVQAHALDLEACEGLLIVHPDWWGQSPAILKGWIDRVLRQGIAYELEGEDGGRKTWRGLMGGKKALVFVTSDSEEPGRGELLRRLWVEATLGPCGFEVEIKLLGSLRSSTAGERAAWLREAVEEAMTSFGLPGT
jgi:putative NADPH-quinone reductase